VWDYYVGARYEREGGWREDTRSRIGTLFAKPGSSTAAGRHTPASARDKQVFQAAASPSVAAAIRAAFTGRLLRPRGTPRLSTPSVWSAAAARHQRVRAVALDEGQFQRELRREDSRRETRRGSAGGRCALGENCR